MPAIEPAEDSQVTAARRTLIQLEEEAARLRAELEDLHGKLATARNAFETVHATPLREANEKLLIAALQAESIAETAISDLDALARSARHDPLTGTPNRNLMLDLLTHAIQLARRHGTLMAVFFLDLDRFKEINDTFGHAVGDEVLQRVARRLQSVLRDSDAVSRHGGDEFLILLAEIRQRSDAALIARKMLEAIAVPCPVGALVLHLSASLGIAVYPDDGKDAASLISQADTAMYCAKRRGNGHFAFYRRETPGYTMPPLE